eukprot:gene846-7319_t
MAEELQEELEVLAEIYEGLKVTQESGGVSGDFEGVKVQLLVQPSEAETGQPQFVQVTMAVHCWPLYPDVPPTITLTRPKGISETALAALYSTLQSEVAEMKGEPMLFALFELVKASLQDSLPSERCSVCLGIFKSPCFHFVHVEKEKAAQRVKDAAQPPDPTTLEAAVSRGEAVECPSCRARIDIVGLPLDTMAATSVDDNHGDGDDGVVVLSEAAQRGQAERRRVYERLKAGAGSCATSSRKKGGQAAGSGGHSGASDVSSFGKNGNQTVPPYLVEQIQAILPDVAARAARDALTVSALDVDTAIAILLAAITEKPAAHRGQGGRGGQGGGRGRRRKRGGGGGGGRGRGGNGDSSGGGGGSSHIGGGGDERGGKGRYGKGKGRGQGQGRGRGSAVSGT